MKVAYFDCFAGVAGDMSLGALIDLGVEVGAIEAAVRSLGVGDFTIAGSRAERAGLGGVRVEVGTTAPQPERHLHEILAALERGDLPPAVRERAGQVFSRLTAAEARVHRVPVERVHLHEVGALDAIVDVVGTCLGLDLLGVERVVSSPVVLGRGMTRGAHGPIPIPGPATLELLEGRPVREGPVAAEMTTPTGAALVSTLAAWFGPLPEMRLVGVGYGAGARDFAELPNLLRVVLGEEATADETEEGSAVVLEANLDDLSPQVLAYVSGRLLEAGALDVWTVAAVMKKGRAGAVLSVLAPVGRAEELGRLLFAETTTLGLRHREVRRRMLSRRFDEVETAYGRVRIKVAMSGESVVNAAPEYDDCVALAAAAAVPLKEVQAAAVEAWRRLRHTSG